MKEDKKIAAALAKAKLPPQAIQVRNTSIYYSVYEIEFILADKYMVCLDDLLAICIMMLMGKTVLNASSRSPKIAFNCRGILSNNYLE